MSIVSPIAACGAVVPFAISIATGERPSGIAVAGAVLALGGAVLASAEERRRRRRTAPAPIVLAARRGGRARPLHLLPRAREPRGQRALDAHRRAGRLADPARAARGRPARVASGRAPLAPPDRRGRPLRRGRERAVRAREPPRAALARLGARLALPGDDRRARLRDPPRAADAGAARRGRRGARRESPR